MPKKTETTLKLTITLELGGKDARREAYAIVNRLLDEGLLQDAVVERAHDECQDVTVTSAIVVAL